MPNSPSEAISDDAMIAANQALDAQLDAFAKTAFKIRDERDQAILVLDTLITNMKKWLDGHPVAEGDNREGFFGTHMAHALDYARDERSRLP